MKHLFTLFVSVYVCFFQVNTIEGRGLTSLGGLFSGLSGGGDSSPLGKTGKATQPTNTECQDGSRGSNSGSGTGGASTATTGNGCQGDNCGTGTGCQGDNCGTGTGCQGDNCGTGTGCQGDNCGTGTGCQGDNCGTGTADFTGATATAESMKKTVVMEKKTEHEMFAVVQDVKFREVADSGNMGEGCQDDDCGIGTVQ
ncbi:jacalin-related lectin 34-like isoform X4 [Agrilus planipennis]|uniref:Jacalin-related lectin 34-like isoform X4 n=1 Tax=Agrilus planipennis TaxID=224129 RepID=A0A7F5RH60_AGRPL|nr:jacalin-related lectin 34-like isoform X4 [Agrilus planipennis]